VNCFLLRLSDNLIFLFKFLFFLLYFLVIMTKNILIIDNYDSFTQNLYHLLVLVRPEYSFTVLRNRDRAIFENKWDCLIVSPGPKGPEDTGLLKEFFETVVLTENLPFLGVCLGLQFLGWYYGLTIIPVEDARHGRTVTIIAENDDLFTNIGRETKVVRYNSLAIKETVQQIEEGTPLLVTAIQKETEMIMAIKHRDHPFSAMQFHPESFLTEKANRMIDNFFKVHLDD